MEKRASEWVIRRSLRLVLTAHTPTPNSSTPMSHFLCTVAPRLALIGAHRKLRCRSVWPRLFQPKWKFQSHHLRYESFASYISYFINKSSIFFLVSHSVSLVFTTPDDVIARRLPSNTNSLAGVCTKEKEEQKPRHKHVTPSSKIKAFKSACQKAQSLCVNTGLEAGSSWLTFDPDRVMLLMSGVGCSLVLQHKYAITKASARLLSNQPHPIWTHSLMSMWKQHLIISQLFSSPLWPHEGQFLRKSPLTAPTCLLFPLLLAYLLFSWNFVTWCEAPFPQSTNVKQTPAGLPAKGSHHQIRRRKKKKKDGAHWRN